jgi:hypothetical protein
VEGRRWRVRPPSRSTRIFSTSLHRLPALYHDALTNYVRSPSFQPSFQARFFCSRSLQKLSSLETSMRIRSVLYDKNESIRVRKRIKTEAR